MSLFLDQLVAVDRELVDGVIKFGGVVIDAAVWLGLYWYLLVSDEPMISFCSRASHVVVLGRVVLVMNTRRV
jgi:hypothetical protein